jgi:ribose/xylose/arabinose/galactoside ABC-type transport system permease subunit
MTGRLLRSEYVVLLLCAGYFAAVAPFTPGMATPANLANILSAMLPLLVVATGQTLVLLAAGIDLSVTSIIAMSSVAGAMVMTGDGGWLAGHPVAVPAAVTLMLAVGAGTGLVNGLCITAFRMPPFIVTLTTMMFVSGAAIWVTGSASYHNLPSGFVVIGQDARLALLVGGAVVVAAHLMTTRTLFGRRLHAVGHNATAALISGVPVARVIVLAYVASGICAAIASVLISGRLETGSPVHWRNNLLDVVGATVIGGTSLYGGHGKVIWTVFGVLFLTMLDNSLNLLNLSYFTIMMVKGGVILLAAVLDASRHGTRAA